MHREVPFLDIRRSDAHVSKDLFASIREVINSGVYLNGCNVELFENLWAQYCEVDYCTTTGSGLDALAIALQALGIGPGDEVIVPSNTFIATWLAVTSTGATPVGVDCSDGSYTICREDVEKCINQKTRAVIAVHLYGYPCDLRPLSELCKQQNILLLEDAAQAHGAVYEGRKIGGYSAACCWSFYPGKNLGCYGNGGAVTTNSLGLATEIRRIANYGSIKKYYHDVKGVNSRLDEIQAAILIEKLKKLDIELASRRMVARLYSEGIDRKDITMPAYNSLDRLSAFHLFVIQVRKREVFQDRMKQVGIQTLIHYPVPVPQQGAYVGSRHSLTMDEIAIRDSERIVSLPIGPHLSKEDVEYVIEMVNRYA